MSKLESSPNEPGFLTPAEGQPIPISSTNHLHTPSSPPGPELTDHGLAPVTPQKPSLFLDIPSELLSIHSEDAEHSSDISPIPPPMDSALSCLSFDYPSPPKVESLELADSLDPPTTQLDSSPAPVDPHPPPIPKHTQIPYSEYPVRPPLSSTPQKPFSQRTAMPFNYNAHHHSTRFPVSHKLNPYFVKAYKLEDELGSGGYGFVMTAKHRNGGHEVAVKFIIKDKVPAHAWMEDKHIGKLPTEVMILSYIDHPNVVKCLDLFEDPLYFYLVQELHGSPWLKVVRSRPYRSVSVSCSSPSDTSTPSLSPSASVDSLGGSEPATPPPSSSPLCSIQDRSPLAFEEKFIDSPSALHPPRPEYSRRPSHDLFECIEQSEHKKLSEEQARYVFSQVVDTVHYLDREGITHRDIKDENLTIDKDLKVKLIDFGSAIIVDPSEPRPYYKLFYGTAAYASSEILRKKPYQAAPAEVWTLGVLLSYLLTGMSPFPSVKEAVEGRIVIPDCASRVPPNAMTLMRRCLDPNPKTRITIDEIKSHSWLDPLQ